MVDGTGAPALEDQTVLVSRGSIQAVGPASISDIRNVVTVFKNGVGYDSAKLFAAVKGTVGVR